MKTLRTPPSPVSSVKTTTTVDDRDDERATATDVVAADKSENKSLGSSSSKNSESWGRKRTKSNKFGNGILQPRKEQIERGIDTIAVATPPRIDNVSHEDFELGAVATDPPLRFPKSLLPSLTTSFACDLEKEEEIEETTTRVIAWCDLSTRDIRRKNKVMDVMLRGESVILRNSGVVGKFDAKFNADSKIGLAQVWNFDHLAKILGIQEGENSARTHAWKCLVCPSDKHRFIECDESKNIFGSDYYVKEPETQSLDCTFSEFVQCARAWKHKSIYFESVITKDPISRKTMPSTDVKGESMFDSKVGSLAIEDIEGLFDWKWFQSLLSFQRFGSILSVKLSAGCRDSLRPCRYSLEDSFIVQIHGRRRILLINPNQTFKGMYPYPIAHPYDKFSMVDLDDVNDGQFPNFSSVRGMTCILKPGDILYIPSGWWRHDHGLCPEHIALEISVAAGQRVRSDESLEILVSRDLERRVGETEGAENIKHWLQIIGRAEESDWIDLGTVRGYQRISMTQMVRDEIDLNLGSGKWSEFLKRMIDGRLDPTPWLNINFREPLYLTDKTERVEDTRNELEKKFPEFYVQKLRLDGYNAEHTPMTIFNPEHPETIAPRK